MATAVVEKIGGKLMVGVPHELEEELNLLEGETVALKRDQEDLTLSRCPRYPLEQLIAEHEGIADLLEEDRAWLDAPRVGRELI